MSKLERATNLVLITVSLVGLAVIVRNEFFPRNTPVTSNRLDLLGRQFSLPGIKLPKAPGFAVFVATRSSCHFCSESLPFYRVLDQKRRTAKSTVPLYFVSSDSVEDLKRYVAGADISPDEVFSVEMRSLGVTVTPTIVVVDSAGTIKHAFYGVLTEQRASELLKLVEQAAL